MSELVHASNQPMSDQLRELAPRGRPRARRRKGRRRDEVAALEAALAAAHGELLELRRQLPTSRASRGPECRYLPRAAQRTHARFRDRTASSSQTYCLRMTARRAAAIASAAAAAAASTATVTRSRDPTRGNNRNAFGARASHRPCRSCLLAPDAGSSMETRRQRSRYRRPVHRLSARWRAPADRVARRTRRRSSPLRHIGRHGPRSSLREPPSATRPTLLRVLGTPVRRASVPERSAPGRGQSPRVRVAPSSPQAWTAPAPLQGFVPISMPR